jgi:hypothetical protein
MANVVLVPDTENTCRRSMVFVTRDAGWEGGGRCETIVISVEAPLSVVLNLVGETRRAETLVNVFGEAE